MDRYPSFQHSRTQDKYSNMLMDENNPTLAKLIDFKIEAGNGNQQYTMFL
jgi:hypothetical protein